jgi:hypothetical protein
MGYNGTPGQSASGFRLFIDKSDKSVPTLREEIIVGAKFKKGSMEYEVKAIDGKDVSMSGYHGASYRSTIVNISDLLNGTGYILKRED